MKGHERLFAATLAATLLSVPLAQAKDAVRNLAHKAGVLAVVPSSPMVTNVGIAQSQGVVQHRVDRIKGVDGKGITVGVMSDSFDTAPTTIRAADDVATGDLPGPGN